MRVPVSLHRPPTAMLPAALFLLLRIASSSSDVPGEAFPKNGAANSADFLPYWEISYYAVDYLPVCGASIEYEGDGYWTNSPECYPAMQAFSTTTTQAAMYDTAGVRSDAGIGQGTSLCICFALVYKPTAGHMLDICLYVGKKGEVTVRDGVAAGVQRPEKNTAKALPECKDVDLSQFSRPGASPTGDNSGSAPSSKMGGPNSLATVAAPTSTSTTADGGGGPKGLTTEGKIALGVGLPGAIISTAAIMWFCYRRRAGAGPHG